MANAEVDKIISGIIQREGDEYTNSRDDAGGPTKYGITQGALSSWRGYIATADEVRALQESEARQIYLNRNYLAPHFDQVAEASSAIGVALVDAGVNNGTGRAARYLQRVLQVMNQQGALYPDIKIDGQIGPGTIAALKTFLRHRGDEGERVLLRAIECLHGADYIALAEANPANETFVYGWINQRVVVA